MPSSIVWCTTPTASRCVVNRCVRKRLKQHMLSVDRVSDRRSWAILTRDFLQNDRPAQKAVEKTGKERPWKSLRDFHFSHSSNNNNLDDRDHFLENATASVAS